MAIILWFTNSSKQFKENKSIKIVQEGYFKTPINHRVKQLCNQSIYLNLGLHILDGIAGLNLKGDCFARQGLDENLHDENTTPMSSLSR